MLENRAIATTPMSTAAATVVEIRCGHICSTVRDVLLVSLHLASEKTRSFRIRVRSEEDLNSRDPSAFNRPYLSDRWPEKFIPLEPAAGDGSMARR
jgi:hypothetical protein